MSHESTQPRLLEAPQRTAAPEEPADPHRYRVLSVPEPLATLILLGVKRIYTTGRFTNHRGPTLIYTPGPRRRPVEGLPREATRAIEGREMHRQAILGTVELQVAAPTEGLNPGLKHHLLTPLELALDDFSHGRYALYLDNPRWLNEPVRATARGQLGRPDPRTLARVMRQLA